MDYRGITGYGAFPQTVSAFLQRQAFRRIYAELLLWVYCFGVRAPQTAHVASFEENRRPDARSVMDGVLLNIADERSGLVVLIAMKHICTLLQYCVFKDLIIQAFPHLFVMMRNNNVSVALNPLPYCILSRSLSRSCNSYEKLIPAASAFRFR